MIEELIARVFYARNVAHFEHWRANGVGGYARHIALGEFYDGVIGALDKLVEAYQGAFELVGTVQAPKTKAEDVLMILTEDAEWIEKNHEKVCKGSRAVGNLVDGVTEVYITTAYKLRNLM
tara:strand:+ start:2972 stop:3334 length:363 start_codon:yes stop_codon:yes gene_type:complete